MEDIVAQVNDFLNKCSELKDCKFIMAPTKIKDLLKSIVNSQTLYELFASVSSGFDYLSAKSKCLVDIADGFNERGVVVLPKSTQDKLAFIFCRNDESGVNGDKASGQRKGIERLVADRKEEKVVGRGVGCRNKPVA